jgi:hypothetical protein
MASDTPPRLRRLISGRKAFTTCTDIKETRQRELEDDGPAFPKHHSIRPPTTAGHSVGSRMRLLSGSASVPGSATSVSDTSRPLLIERLADEMGAGESHPRHAHCGGSDRGGPDVHGPQTRPGLVRPGRRVVPHPEFRDKHPGGRPGHLRQGDDRRRAAAPESIRKSTPELSARHSIRRRVSVMSSAASREAIAISFAGSAADRGRVAAVLFVVVLR